MTNETALRLVLGEDSKNYFQILQNRVDPALPYNGSLEKMLHDLRAKTKRQPGKPFMYKQARRCEKDLERVENLIRWEFQFNGKYHAIDDKKTIEFQTN